MKFTVSSGELLSRLTVVGKAIAAKSPLPILDHFLFTINGNTLSIRGSETEVTIDTTLEITDVEGEGRYVVPGAKLCEYLRKLSEQPICFNINAETNTIETKTQSGITKQIVYDATDYPEMHTIAPDTSTKITISSNILINGIAKTAFATSNDELRPALMGMLIECTQGSVTFVATNSHILSRYIATTDKSTTDAKFILSKRSATLMKGILTKDEEVTIEFNEKLAKLTTSNYVVTCRLIEAVYPAYNKLIQDNNPYNITINRSELLNSISRASIFANGTCLVKLTCNEDTMKIVAQDTDLHCSSQETMTCVYTGQQLTIGFKSTHIIEILSNMTSEEVIINIGDPSRPGLIMPAVPTENENELMLLMPMMAN